MYSFSFSYPFPLVVTLTSKFTDIRYLIYTRKLSQERQTAYIATFNTTETFRVLLINVYEAAHGLHIASASRVFFINPVWQPNVEAQAIKRAHRIGQTRAVYVETLVLKDTLEDQMLQRRKGMTPQEHQKAERSLLDDSTMSTIIQNARFIELSDEEIRNTEQQMAKLEIPQQLFARVGKSEGDADDPDADLVFPEDISTSRRPKKSQTRSTGRKAAGKTTAASTPSIPASVATSDPHSQAVHLGFRNEADTLQHGSPSASKQKIDHEHALDFDPTPSSSRTKATPPADLSGPSAPKTAMKRVGFALDVEDDPPSLFGGSSPPGPSSKRRAIAPGHNPASNGTSAPTRRIPQTSPISSASSTTLHYFEEIEPTGHPAQRGSASKEGPSQQKKAVKKVGFALETDDA